MNDPILTILSFLIIFTVVVVSHEFGHYLIARMSGIRVNEFSIGMGPAIFRKKGKVTEFVIRLLPIGGACIFEGDEGNAALDGSAFERGDGKEGSEGESSLKAADPEAGNAPAAGSDTDKGRKARYRAAAGEYRSFREAPVWSRIASVFAGPFFNVILAYLLALFIVWFCGADLPVVHSVMDDYPAQAAGIEAGDEILSVDGLRTHLWREVMVRSYMNSGQEMTIKYRRNGQEYTTKLVPKYDEEAERYFIGFSGGAEYVDCANLKVLKYSWFERTTPALGERCSIH